MPHAQAVVCLVEWCRGSEDNAKQGQLHGVSEVLALASPQPWSPSKFEFNSLDNGDFEVDNEIAEEAEDSESEDLHDIEAINAYFVVDGDWDMSAGAWPSRCAYAAIPDNYVRVVHSNGLHYILLVSCHCHNGDGPHLDLLAAQLMPASLKRIRTLFTMQVLDLFQLSNLELKASAYQFYQLLWQLTQPMAPGEVVNLYREFWRMSWLWQWMKKLKWASYTSNSKKVHQVQPGELAIYCPACPQPGINILDNWREDPSRDVSSYF